MKYEVGPLTLINFVMAGILIGVLLSILAIEIKRLDHAQEQIEDTQGRDLSLKEEEILKECEGRDMYQTAICLNNQIKRIYKYIDRYYIGGNKIRDYEEIVEEGGNCYDYSTLYEKWSEELGFNSTTRSWMGVTNVTYGHRFAFIWNDTDHCLLDMTSEVRCLGNDIYGRVYLTNETSR